MSCAAVRTKSRVARSLEVSGDRSTSPPQVLVAAGPTGLPKLWVRKLRDTFAIHELTDPADLQPSLVSLKPDILLLDLTIPQLGGIHSLSSLQQLSPSTKIVLLAGHPDKKEWLSGLRAGAWGYCEKAGAPGLLKTVLETVHKGEVWVSRTLVADMIEELSSIHESRQTNKINRSVTGK